MFLPHTGNFNSRPSARGDAPRSAISRRTRYFNSRPSARGDPRRSTGGEVRANFNSRPSARGDFSRLANLSDMLFQFTPLREGRRAQFAGLRSALIFQFTPLREGRRVRVWLEKCSSISIHAPPRGATLIGMIMPSPYAVFQFTPLREGRH